MKTTDEKKAFLEGLTRVRDKNLDRRQKDLLGGAKRDLERSKNLPMQRGGDLNKDVLRASGGSMSPDVSEPVTRYSAKSMPDDAKQTLKGTDVIDTKEVQKISNPMERVNKVEDFRLNQNLKATMKDALEKGDTDTVDKLMRYARKFGKGATKGLKALPLIGGIAAAVSSGDVSAAVPILGDAENLGPQEGSLEAMAEDPSIPTEQRIEIMKKLKEKYSNRQEE